MNVSKSSAPTLCALALLLGIGASGCSSNGTSVPDPSPAEEAARLAAEQEAARLAAEQEAARLAAEQEAARLAAEQEAARLAAEQEAARLAAEQEAARLAAEQEAARLAAEQEAARHAAEHTPTPPPTPTPPAGKVPPANKPIPGPVHVTMDSRSKHDATVTYTSEDVLLNSYPYENRVYHLSVEADFSDTSNCENNNNILHCVNQGGIDTIPVKILNEDGSIARDHDDGTLDQRHHGLKKNECPDNGVCHQYIRFLYLTGVSEVDNEYHMYGFYVPVVGLSPLAKDNPYAFPQQHHLDHMAYGAWLELDAKSLLTMRFGGTFYEIAPDFEIVTDQYGYHKDHGIRGKATYTGHSFGLASRTNDYHPVEVPNVHFIGYYDADVSLSANFGPTYKFNNNFEISGKINNIVTDDLRGYHGHFPIHQTITLQPVEGGISQDGKIWTKPGIAQATHGQYGRLQGTWDVSFHGRANKIRDNNLKEDFHRPPPVIAGNITAESEYHISDTEYGTIQLDGVIATFKNSESIEYTGKGR